MSDPQKETPPEQHQRLCDYCNDRAAVLYCRADTAKLCLTCDREVHSTNQLFSKHSRSQLCDACDASPASIFCETEHSVFCTNCDWENHNNKTLHLSSSNVHNRRPIESFTGCPSVTELLTIVGFDDLDNKDGNDCVHDDVLSDYLVWDASEFLSIDNLIVPNDSTHNFQALDVPPLPKNRNAACGLHKEEMLYQLRQLAKFEPNLKFENVEPITQHQSWVDEPKLPQPGNRYHCSGHDPEPISFPSYEDNALEWFQDSCDAANQLPSALSEKYFEESCIVPQKQLDNSVSNGYEGRSKHLVNATESTPVFSKVAQIEINTQERDSAITRYKEKKKTRRYDKHIRYESRKARAETRTRVKGRFAKIDH